MNLDNGLKIYEIPLAQIDLDPEQPRKKFDLVTLNQFGIKDAESRVYIRKYYRDETIKILAQEEGV